MERRKVIIDVEGGVAELVDCPEDVVVEIRDYDGDAEDPVVTKQQSVEDL